MKVLLTHDILHIPYFGKVHLELLSELFLCGWQIRSSHELEQVPEQAESDWAHQRYSEQTCDFQ